jgi:hypothetical protein
MLGREGDLWELNERLEGKVQRVRSRKGGVPSEVGKE